MSVQSSEGSLTGTFGKRIERQRPLLLVVVNTHVGNDNGAAPQYKDPPCAQRALATVTADSLTVFVFDFVSARVCSIIYIPIVPYPYIMSYISNSNCLKSQSRNFGKRARRGRCSIFGEYHRYITIVHIYIYRAGLLTA